MRKAEHMQRFHLLRLEDETGTSGKGVVAEGIKFTDGTVVVRWLSPTPTTVVHDDIDSVMKIHGHNGKTQIVWKDE
jgi:hypothetical protein